MNPNTLIVGDCLDVISAWPNNCVDLVFGSPPYEAARTYGIDCSLTGEDWVAWMKPRVREFCRVSRGLVVIVAWGTTRNRRYSPVCEMLLADLHREGIHSWRPAIYRKANAGIPGSGGDQGLRSDWEYCLIFKPPGRLPWADNTACGHPPKWGPGGAMSHRQTNGTRVNQSGATESPNARDHTKSRADGSTETQHYTVPALANPGDVIECMVGGGHLGSDYAHEGEAPFPVKLAEFWIKSYCPPGGIVCDPFCGSGTTIEAALHHGRNYVGIDLRQSQVDLTRERLGLFAGLT